MGGSLNRGAGRGDEAALRGLSDWMTKGNELAPVTALLGIRPIKIGEGSAVLTMKGGAAHHNAHGTLHGGLLCALADVAMGVALMSTLHEEGFATLHQEISHIRSVVESELRAEVEVAQRGRRIGHVRCTIFNENRDAVAEASSVCMITKNL